jgi:hypothetical protein
MTATDLPVIDFRRRPVSRTPRVEAVGLPLDARGHLSLTRDSALYRLLRGMSMDPSRPTTRAGLVTTLQPWRIQAAYVDTMLGRLLKGGVIERVAPGQYVRLWNELPDGVTS